MRRRDLDEPGRPAEIVDEEVVEDQAEHLEERERDQEVVRPAHPERDPPDRRGHHRRRQRRHRHGGPERPARPHHEQRRDVGADPHERHVGHVELARAHHEAEALSEEQRRERRGGDVQVVRVPGEHGEQHARRGQEPPAGEAASARPRPIRHRATRAGRTSRMAMTIRNPSMFTAALDMNSVPTPSTAAEEQAAEHRAGQAPHPADDDDDERLHHRQRAHRRAHREDRREEGAGGAGQRAADAEAQHGHHLDVHALERGGVGVLGRRAHGLAGPRPLQEGVETGDEARGDEDDHEPLARDHHAARAHHAGHRRTAPTCPGRRRRAGPSACMTHRSPSDTMKALSVLPRRRRNTSRSATMPAAADQDDGQDHRGEVVEPAHARTRST